MDATGLKKLGPSSRTFPETHITYYDLNLRVDITIYGRKHRIVDCDPFTRNFLEGLGISVPPSEPEPEDGFRSAIHQFHYLPQMYCLISTLSLAKYLLGYFVNFL
jgi:hypothetical protein